MEGERGVGQGSDEDGNEDLIPGRLPCFAAIQAFMETGALKETVKAMTANLDSPAFISSCFELLVALVNKADKLIAEALQKTEILAVLDKIVHACGDLGVDWERIMDSTCFDHGTSDAHEHAE
ncbi:hypothetical protein PC119_g11579 [Phytophthora cactorum]|uniref:Uncharacterized protein n=1 Tax=Phytophthora cactorum TaxID=29920 RepID=A0A8T1DZT2_9STRA|nr:hypothetical protein PC117_g8569 [Phytophthora cactorum]KAG3015881.1 hypothetical protein PC119_g11579 [Phytophthora cactorum]KAG3020264.1 hypothetical protein PC120_g9358 [Phytophthora cactorum]KAG3059053.1 hypothetical protein PC121_g14112 [Phytophthora cactorum]KAG3090044.1 hypothetical protein PC122_g7599 [Phytophthora cactorum]